MTCVVLFPPVFFVPTNCPRNCHRVLLLATSLLALVQDYERIIQKLHVDELSKKIGFIRNVPAFKSFPEEVITDLAARCFIEKFPIFTTLWEQNDTVDSMKYMAIIRYGEGE